MTAAAGENPDENRQTEEEDALVRWRYDRARALGLNETEAELFSGSSISMHDLAEYVGRGCDPATALRILAPL